MSTVAWSDANDVWMNRCDDRAHQVRNQSRSCSREDRRGSMSSMPRLPLNRSSNIILGMMALAIIAVVTCPVTLAFSTPLHLRQGAITRPLQLKHSNNVEYSQRRHPTFVSLYRDHENEESDEDENDENGEEEDVVFYDDFGGTVLGGVDPPPPIVYQDMDVPIGSVVDDSSSSFAELQEGLQVLSERIAQTRDSQVQRDTRLAKNWRMGNWKVRGFQLDKSNMDSTTTTKPNSNHPRTTLDADSTASLVTGGPRLDNANRNSDNNPQQTNHDPLSKLLQEVSSNNQDTDKDASHNTSSNDGPIHVSKIVTDISSSSSGGLESNILAVGRTDGSICIVELGTQYLTKFTAVPKLIVEPGNNETEDGGISVRIQSELMNQDELKEAMRDDHGSDEKYTMPRPKQDGDNEINFSDGMDESFGEGDDGDNTLNDDVAMAEQDTMGTPFKILHQFQAHEKGDSITALVLDEGHVYSAGGNKGDIKVWAIPEDEDQENESNNGSEVRSAPKMIPVKSLSNAHADTVVALKTLSMDGSEDHQLLLSAAADGSFALWDRTSGDLVFRCQITDDYGEPVSVTCADVETVGENHVIYLGLSTGHVVGYIVNDVITSASIGDECLVPSCRFVAQEADSGGLTALTCAGDGTIGISSRSRSGQTPQSSTVLLTGGADGTIKQWEMMSRKKPPGPDDNKGPSTKLEHWPRLTTQRMQRRAHLFRGHSGPITALVCNDPSKFLSAGADGTVRIWSPSKGTEMFRMDGFSDSCRSLCLDHDLLVTDGMEEYVCVHDFDVTDAEIEEGYKLEW